MSHEMLAERAREVGRLVAQTDEYKALKRANDRLEEDRESIQLLNRLRDLQYGIANALQVGREPSEEQQQEYEQLIEQLQTRTGYQGVVAAQANFDRLMMRINEDIAKGIEAGEQSRIIFPS